MFVAFGNRNYRNYWFTNAFSVVGSWMQASAQQWYVLGLAPDPATGVRWLALVSACQFLPTLLLSLFAGVILDRLERRKVLMASQILLMTSAVVLGVLILRQEASFTVVAFLAILSGIGNAFDIPARQSLVPQLVERAQLANAVALNSLLFNLGRVLGASAFGLLAPVVGIATIYFLNAASFLGFLLVLFGLRLQQDSHQSQNLWQEIGAGLGYVWQTPTVRAPILLLAALSVTVINFSIIIPVFAKNALGLQEGGFGLLGAAFGAGAMASALLQAQFGGSSKILRMNIGAWLLTLGVGGLSFTPNLPLACLLLFVAGAGMITYTINANATVQLATPDALRGRVMSVYTLVFAGLNPVGALLVGQLMALLGVRNGIALVASLAALACLLLRPREIVV
jgi:MFS family permease